MNYGRLNEETVKDNYQTPRLHALLRKITAPHNSTQQDVTVAAPTSNENSILLDSEFNLHSISTDCLPFPDLNSEQNRDLDVPPDSPSISQPISPPPQSESPPKIRSSRNLSRIDLVKIVN